MSLKILHVIQTVDPASGGPIEGIRQAATAHRSFGHTVEIACCDRPSEPFLAFPGVPVYPLQLSWWDGLFPFTLLDWLKKHRCSYDGVVVNGIWGFHLLATYLALKGSKTSMLVFCHGMLDPWFRWRYPFKHFKKWLVWPWVIHPPLQFADAVCFTCEKERLLARQSFWLYDVNEQVVAYGTHGIPDPSHNYVTQFLKQHPAIVGRKCLLFLGRVAPKKGADLLFQAVAALQRDGLWDSWTHCLVMAGPATGHYAESLVHLAQRLGITDSIHWTGMLQGDQKWGAFQAADVFVLPSHQENFGIVVAEALSSSTPVLLTHPVNIAPDIVSDRAGLVDVDTRAGVTRLLRRWFTLSAAERAAMACGARRCFEHRYDIRKVSISLTRVLQLSILERKLKR